MYDHYFDLHTESTPDTFAFNYHNVTSKLKELKFPETRWRDLGTALKLRADRLESIAADRKADNPVNQTNALLGLLSKWLRQDVDSTWEKLAKAIGELGYSDLSDELKSVKGKLVKNALNLLPLLCGCQQHPGEACRRRL